MKQQKLVIDTSRRMYLLDEKDISSHLIEINIRMRGNEKIVELRYDKPYIVISGMLVENLYPIVCDCGYRISNAGTDCDCCCPKCGKRIIFQEMK